LFTSAFASALKKGGNFLAEITLTDELVRDIGGLSAPEAGVGMYEQASIRELHGTRFLVGHGRPAGIFSPEHGAWDPDRGGLFRPVDSPFSTLFSLLDLVHEPISWEALDSCVPPERAVQWCRDHGLPESEHCYDADRVWFPSEWSLDDWACLPLEIFQKQVLTLFLCFHCWRILVDEQWDQLDAVLIALSDTPDRIQGLPLEVKQHYARWNLLSSIMTQRVERIRPRYSWSLGDDGSTNGTPGIRLVASSLFDYVFFQLAQLTMKPKNEIKQKLKLCRGCSRFFWGHGNRRHCLRPGCDRRTIWSRNHRHPAEGMQQTRRHGAPLL
jgi:hypothetical protein